MESNTWSEGVLDPVSSYDINSIDIIWVLSVTPVLGFPFYKSVLKIHLYSQSALFPTWNEQKKFKSLKCF